MKFKTWEAVRCYLEEGYSIVYEGVVLRFRKSNLGELELNYLSDTGNWFPIYQGFGLWSSGRLVDNVTAYRPWSQEVKIEFQELEGS